MEKLSSKLIKERLGRSEFDSFRTQRKNELIARRSYFERQLEDWIEYVGEQLKDRYRFQIIPQKTTFIKEYGLVYVDVFVRVICRKEKLGVDYGHAFCVELDEPYHDTKRQKSLDQGREKAILKKLRNVRIIRIRLNEMNDQQPVLKKLRDAFDFWKPGEIDGSLQNSRT